MKTFLIIFFTFLLLQGYSQQYNNWYFGKNASLSFNPIISQPTPFKLDNGALITRFACSNISDTAGNLLFYTNGVTVYNRNHTIMLNGAGLAGDTYSEQGSIIIPHPAYDSIFYIFTSTQATGEPSDGYYYSMVDIAKDGGNGTVTVKNILLSPFNTERLTAVRHADGISVWVITNDRFSNKFNAWLITCDGLQPSPVVSRSGEVLGDYFTDWTALNGMMKVSPDGKQLCQTQEQELDSINDPNRFFQLFDFDNATGRITNPRKIIYEDDEIASTCEFSPDSRFLYVNRHSSYFQQQPLEFSVDQLESKLSTEAEMIASRTRIVTCSGQRCQTEFWGMQAGPDGKIYLNRDTTRLSVISRPNVKSTGCMFELDKIDLGGRTGVLGLPSMINDGPYDPYNNFTTHQIDSCRGIVQFNGTTAMQGAIEWHWDFGDGATSTLQNPQHTFSTYNQPYNVKLSIRSLTNCGYIVRKNITYPRGTYTKPMFDMVTRCDSGYTRFINTSVILPDTSIKKYSWDFGDGTTSTEQDPIHRYAVAGAYQVKLKITTSIPCIADSITKNLELKQLNIQAPPNQSVDAGQAVHLYVTGAGSSFQWSPPRWLNDATIANPVAKPMDTITYTVTVTDDAGCKANDSVTLFVKNEVKGINVPSAFTPNNDGLNDIIRPILGSQFTLKEFNIFNRWGQKIYSTSEAGEGWDGKQNDRLKDSGVYVWVIIVTDGQDKTITKNGTVMLIR